LAVSAQPPLRFGDSDHKRGEKGAVRRPVREPRGL